MNLKQTTSLVFVLLFLVGISQEVKLNNKEAVLSNITETAKKTSSIVADFRQEKKLTYLKDKQISNGKFYSENGNMRWEQKEPYQYIMLISETEGLKIKDEGKEKNYGAMADKFMSQIKNVLLSSVNAQFENNDDFDPSYFENESYYIVKLKPNNRKLSKLFDQIILSFDKTSYRLKILSFVQSDGVSNMYFSNEILNQELKTTLFTQF